MGPDALSRNNEYRDVLNLARISDWTQLKQTIRGVASLVAEGEFDDENPPLYTEDPTKELPKKHIEVLGKRPGDENLKCEQCMNVMENDLKLDADPARQFFVISVYCIIHVLKSPNRVINPK